MLETLVGILGAVLIGVVTWGINLNSRIAVLESDKTNLKEFMAAQFAEVNRRLALIEGEIKNGASHSR